MTVSVMNRTELKKELAEAVLNGDMLVAKIRLVFLEEMITEKSFESIEEIAEFYQVKHFIDAQF